MYKWFRPNISLVWVHYIYALIHRLHVCTFGYIGGLIGLLGSLPLSPPPPSGVVPSLLIHCNVSQPFSLQAQYRNDLIQAEMTELRSRVRRIAPVYLSLFLSISSFSPSTCVLAFGAAWMFVSFCLSKRCVACFYIFVYCFFFKNIFFICIAYCRIYPIVLIMLH